jgi:hypothetical protein
MTGECTENTKPFQLPSNRPQRMPTGSIGACFFVRWTQQTTAKTSVHDTRTQGVFDVKIGNLYQFPCL